MLFARLLAVKPLGQVQENFADTQFGLRQRRSTSDPVHIVRRAQDLVQAKNFATLHVVFLDWEKACGEGDRHTGAIPAVARAS
eukprot:9162859-Alexandrium_andersonii.AAC.1